MQPRIALLAVFTLFGLISAAEPATAQYYMPGYPPQGRPAPGCGAGASFYYLMPFFDNNTAYITVNEAETTQKSTDFEWNFVPAGAIWFGMVNEYGSGVRARYFHFDNSSNTLSLNQSAQTVTAPPSLNQPGGNAFVSPGVLGTQTLTGDKMTFDSDLQVNTADIEFVYEWSAGPLGLLFSGGGRAQRISQTYLAVLTNTFDGGGGMISTELQRLESTNEFNGGGPTVAVQGRWDAGAGWSVFGMMRGALLVGQANRDTGYRQVVVDPNFGFDTDVTTQTSASATKLLPVTEIELGVEYGWCGNNSQWVIRSALVNQTFFGAGTPANDEGNLSLFGLQFTIGCAY